MTIYLTILLTLFALGYGIFFLFTNISFHSIPDSVWASATLGISGGLVYMAKEIPDKIYKWCEIRFSFKIETLSEAGIQYKILSDWVANIDHPIITNNIKMDRLGISSVKKNLAYGEYLFFIDTLTAIRIIKSLHDRTQNSFDHISVQIFGLRRDKFVKLLEKEFENVVIQDGVHIITDRWGQPTIVEKKSFDYIFSPQKEGIITCINKWRESEEIFSKTGTVYKLGILLYGKPGTGKSSFARAIATDLGWEINSINLSYTSSADLIYWMSNLYKNSIVLLEDVDCCTSNRADENDSSAHSLVYSTGGFGSGKTSLDVLLNVLDGIYSPSNVIFIATTNYIDRLDDAFKRPGRFDCKFEMEELDKSLAIEMCDKFGASITVLKGESYPINQAYLQGKILDNITDYKKV